MADTIRGNGLFRADSALAALVEDPQRLDRARMRFSDSPPSYRSYKSHNSTRSQSPNPPSEEQQRREERTWQLKRERDASLAYRQFDAQTTEERHRIIEADANRTHRVPVGTDFYKLAHENVRNQWVEQGIWNAIWDDMASGPWKWKHEEPLELGSQSGTNSDSKPRAPLFSLARKRVVAKPRRQKNDEEMRLITERQAALERERDASRPFHQFVYQISKERNRIRDESRVSGFNPWESADINTKAYENVKNTWTKRGIWNKKWGILPGMSWKHEQPPEEIMDDDPTPTQASQLEGDNNREASPRRIFESSSPVELNHGQASCVLNESQQELSMAIDPARLQDDNANHSSSAPNSRRRPRESKQVLRPAAGRKPRRGEREPPHDYGQTQPIARTALGPVHPSKVSKGIRKKRPGTRQRLSTSKEMSSDAQLPISGLETPKPRLQAAPIPPRRSKRLQEAEYSVADDPARAASANLLKNVKA